ncbi:hypothetical protein L3X38_008785 [Prunus dulcis]|uniref:Ubiquitin-like protease family profile domain-containing protein n=1 Tax=Prunus dulcis TaxID=3755 RepID=A0AAD4ZX41_PRUDU|nr:hypothetical protein L3X38_008785 [Prunus dulcis]
MSVSDATATQPCFDPSKPLPIEDVKAVIEFCIAWKNDISAEVQLESFSVGADFFYKLFDETEWISSRHLDMATFLIRKKETLSSVGIWNSLDNGTSLLQFLEPFKATAKKRGSKKAAASNTIDLPPSKLNNIHHYVRDSEVEEVKQKGMQMSRSTPFSVCSIADVPQQRDGTSCGIMTVKFIEHLSAGISLDKVDRLKIKYYRLKLAIEGTPLYEDADVDALMGHYVVIGIWNLKLCLLILAGAGYTSTILLKNGKLSDLIGELQSLLNGTGEQSEGDFDAIASQVSRLAAEVRQLGWSRQITVLKGNDSQIAATLGALGYGYMWWKGLKFSDLMYVTKRSMTAAILNLHTHLESVTEAIANTKKHLTKRVQNLDDKLLEQKEISKSILESSSFINSN